MTRERWINILEPSESRHARQRIANRKFAASHPGYWKTRPDNTAAERKIRWRYKLSKTELDSIKKQDPDCAICHSEDRLTIDHNHETGLVRGRLCNRCNGLLAALEDSAWVKAAQEYLEDRNA